MVKRQISFQNSLLTRNHHDCGQRMGGGDSVRRLGAEMPGVAPPRARHRRHSAAFGQHAPHHRR